MHDLLQEAYLVGVHLQGFLQVQGLHLACPAINALNALNHARVASAWWIPYEHLNIHVSHALLHMQHDKPEAHTAWDQGMQNNCRCQSVLSAQITAVLGFFLGGDDGQK